MKVYVNTCENAYYKLMFHKNMRVLTPLSIVSLLSLHFMNRTTFQLVLQFTELT